jgi:predicted transposase YdaD
MINLAHVDITRTSWYQEGRLEGKLEGKREGMLAGKQEGEQVLLLRLLTKRFGKLTKTVTKKIEQLPLEQLEQLADDFFSLRM